ncbi:MAG TPA: M1 family metallopeptidase [Bacteroidota bacterium]|nr:M1 family metallopeptidase [Bacteroidota bacterium]
MRTFIQTVAIAMSIAAMAGRTDAQETEYPTARVYVQPGTEPAEHPVDMKHMRVELRFDTSRKLVIGRVTHTFTPLRSRVDSIFFNGPGIIIREASLNGRKVAFRTSPEGVTVYPAPALTWGAKDSITFRYEATPERGLYFVGWDDPRGLARKQIWTQGQGIDNRHWIPCYDQQNDKMTTETIITFDSAYSVLSNGTKLGVRENGDGTRTWHYRMTHPHATYLVMLAIGKYGVKTLHAKSGTPVNLWYYPEFPERVGPTYVYATAIVDFLAAETGVPYPWESYSQVPVRDFLYGGMENTTATVFGDFLFVDTRAFLDRNYIAVNAHECAHQWFGDFVTGRAGKYAWLHESFATFYAKLFQKSVFGEEWYQWARREEQDAALEASKLNRLPIVHAAAGGARVYQKGSAVLDMMMKTFGHEEFRRVIKSYLLSHAYANVETNDLYQAFQDALGETPDWFFNEWIYGGGEPAYRVRFEDVAAPGERRRRSVFTVTQTQKLDDMAGLFRMPIAFEVHYEDGTKESVSEVIADTSSTVTIPNPGAKPVAFALFDPGGWILKSVDFEKPFPMLKSQALGAPAMIDRYDAVRAMRTIDDAAKRDLLRRVYDRETFHAIREEILAQCAGDSQSVGLIRRGLKDTSATVRRAALEAASGPLLGALRGDAEEMLRDSSYTNIAMALELLARRFPEESGRYASATEGVRGTGHNVSVLACEIKGRNGDTSSVSRLLKYAGVSYEFMTRVNALEALRRLGVCDTRLYPALFSAMTNPNGRLRAPAEAFASYFMKQEPFAAPLRSYYRTHTWTPAQRVYLEPYFK